MPRHVRAGRQAATARDLTMSGRGRDHLALAGALARRRAPRRLPSGDGGVAERAVRRLRPSPVEQVHQMHRPGLGALEHALAGERMHPRLLAREKTGADPARPGARRQRRRQPAPVRDGPGGDHRRLAHPVDHRRDRRHRRHHAAQMAAGLPALRHDHLHAGIDRALRGLRSADPEHHDGARVPRPADQRPRILPDEGDDANALLDTGVAPVLLRERHLAGCRRRRPGRRAGRQDGLAHSAGSGQTGRQIPPQRAAHGREPDRDLAPPAGRTAWGSSLSLLFAAPPHAREAGAQAGRGTAAGATAPALPDRPGRPVSTSPRRCTAR